MSSASSESTGRPSISGASLLSTNDRTAEPLYQVKLLAALRSGDPALIHPFLTEISKEKRRSQSDDGLDTGAAALHLAIRCASTETVAQLLSHRAISPNGVHPPGSGTTPLHLAASLGRVDVVSLLLEQDNIDDTRQDSHNRTCKDIAKTREVIKVIDDSRTFLNASYRSLLRSYILSPPNAPPSQELSSLLTSPRHALIDFSYLDDGSGTSLLHEAAKRKDLKTVELAIRAGADVFLRDRQGRTAYQPQGTGANKDDRVGAFLRQFANNDPALLQPTKTVEPQPVKGYLNKYTNVARGYSTRWFVLEGGVLSYYRHKDDETLASRGSIAMKAAIIRTPTNNSLRFEVHSTPAKGHQNQQKWFMKANHPVEAARWVQALNASAEWSRRESISSNAGASGAGTPRLSMNRTLTGLSMPGSPASAYIRAPSALSDVEPAGDSPEYDSDTGSGGHGSKRTKSDESDTSLPDSARSIRQVPPHESTINLQSSALLTQAELLVQLLAASPPPVTTAVQDALNTINEYIRMIQDREHFFQNRQKYYEKKLVREREKRKVWEESLATVVREGELLERELRSRSRKRGSKFFDADELGRRQSIFAGVRQPHVVQEEEAEAPQHEYIIPPVQVTGEEGEIIVPRTVQSPVSMPIGPPITRKPPPPMEDEEADNTDEEDEFFDAIDAGTLPNLVVPSALASPTHEGLTIEPYVDLDSYYAYKTLRTRLALDEDQRPNTSLWSVLKHSIGKDLTKISFPVFFNEPTSMLQRMAEDMEFSECLDVAAKETDQWKRMAFVAAFAMSNYSSTIGRIAKPFNPMLGETFEYARFDKEYRYMSEQVSHHPPISACWAESPFWRYFGEVDAQNKFMGKSFEIRPTGVAHAELILPEHLAPNYPKATKRPNTVLEHYTWKKVTTNVSGFILGSPTIDHYGDMNIINHRTGDTCTLSFKPRGWRGKDAFEIIGQVRDARGNVRYDIAGRWNSQLVARAAGTGTGFLHPDVSVEASGLNSPSLQEYILLWRNSEKPRAPFNLTPFAITLNDCPAELRPYLCPTDCRLRPDQRAFELGKYELANGLKTAQEEKQRATRRAREEGRLPSHKPRWFTAETDRDTGERVWSPVLVEGTQHLEYWQERERVWKEGGNVPWDGVDHIFIEEPAELNGGDA